MGLTRVFFLVIGLIVAFYGEISAQNDLFYTDKYDANYLSNSSKTETELYFGSDLFQFLNSENINKIGEYVDSFLTNENVVFDRNIVFENENRLKVNIGKLNAEQCRKLSEAWNEKYKIDFLKLVSLQINDLKTDSINWTSQKIIFYSLIMDEKNRFFNPSNSVSNINIAFIIPKYLSENNFKIVFTHYNTKRYSAKESHLTATEVIYSNNLKKDELKFDFPSLNRQTFLKNCLSLKILENITPSINFKTDYFVNQCITSFQVTVSDTNINEFSVYLDTNILLENQYKTEIQKAFNQIVKISNEQLFYYSYYDIQKLKAMFEEYNLATFKEQIIRLNNRQNFIISINEDNHFKIGEMNLTSFKRNDFLKDIPFKTNSIQFENQEDTVLLIKIEQFLKVNPNYMLSIISTSKPSEYLFIEKEKRLALINKYTETGYVISSKKKLALYRSLTIFSRFTDSGIDFKKLRCIGLIDNSSVLSLSIISLD